MFEDRLEIFSPGSFPGMIPLQNLGEGTTFLRNLVAARIARKMRLIEKLGTGIRLIFDSCRHAGLKTPEYSEDGDYVKTTFFFQKVATQELLSSASILSIVEKEGELKPRDLTKHCGVFRCSISRKLAQLAKEGSLQRIGKRAGILSKFRLRWP